MEITKEASLRTAGAPTEQQLTAINRLAKSPLAAEQVYVFSLRLCDDQVDRDQERFDTGALPELARLFVGKTGIMDHRWAAQGQVARIFAAQVVREGEVSYIKAWAYIRRSEWTLGLIGDIEAGIKKEVSVGCAMGGAICSVCGAEYGSCGHEKGREYGGKRCCAVLTEPRDAYEFSFVAVPAQKQAGILKGKDGAGNLKLGQLVEKLGGPAAAGEYDRLSKEAALGRRFQEELRNEVVRLCLVLELGLPEANLRRWAEKLEAHDLEELKKALSAKTAKLFPGKTQLPGGGGRQEGLESEFLI